MMSWELLLDMETLRRVEIKLGDDFKSIFDKLNSYNYKIDEYTDRTYLTLADKGVSFSFNYDVLSSIFLYIENDKIIPFNGSLWFLDNEFWQSPNRSTFQSLAESNGFSKWHRDHKNWIDMVSDNFRMRYSILCLLYTSPSPRDA